MRAWRARVKVAELREASATAAQFGSKAVQCVYLSRARMPILPAPPSTLN
jgi:hypothetical protein